MKEFKILLLEDTPTDAELILHDLTKGGLMFTSRVVGNEKDFSAAMKEFAPDIVLTDYSLPSFDGFSVLKIVHESYSNTPVIFVSGVVGDEMMVRALKDGAADFIPKNELSRLVPAIRRLL